MKIKLLFIVGARPNFIKVSPLCNELKQRSGIEYKIVHTGQHYDKQMSDVFFDELNIPAPDYNLSIGSGKHGRQTGLMMDKLEELCSNEVFSALIVIGDVNSTLAGALVGAKSNIPVIHVESGLRSFNRTMPEEVNRIVTDHISELLFAPTQLALENLAREGLESRSYFSGDVMYDTILQGLQRAQAQSSILNKMQVLPESYYLATLHRPYNVDVPEQLKEIFDGYAQLEIPVILSAHPRLKKNLEKFGIKPSENIRITAPLGYLDFIVLQKNARKIITDSGGVQKEAFFLQRPCITLRPETEWVETVDAEANVLVKDRKAHSILEAVNRKVVPQFHKQPYGDGNASKIIIDLIEKQFG